MTLVAGIAQNHSFLQGSKRPDFEAGAMMINLNGWMLDGGIGGLTLADDCVGPIEHRLDEADFSPMLRPHVRPRD